MSVVVGVSVMVMVLTAPSTRKKVFPCELNPSLGPMVVSTTAPLPWETWGLRGLHSAARVCAGDAVITVAIPATMAPRIAGILDHLSAWALVLDVMASRGLVAVWRTLCG